MTSSQSSRISSLIKELSAIEAQSNGSIYENENLRTDAAHLVRKLAVTLERPQEVVLMNSSIVRWLYFSHTFSFFTKKNYV
jgi:regulator of replication initiation timing